VHQIFSFSFSFLIKELVGKKTVAKLMLIGFEIEKGFHLSKSYDGVKIFQLEDNNLLTIWKAEKSFCVSHV
jgi:hypothetical protein